MVTGLIDKARLSTHGILVLFLEQGRIEAGGLGEIVDYLRNMV